MKKFAVVSCVVALTACAEMDMDMQNVNVGGVAGAVVGALAGGYVGLVSGSSSGT